VEESLRDPKGSFLNIENRKFKGDLSKALSLYTVKSKGATLIYLYMPPTL
jgi:hypothetical protein